MFLVLRMQRSEFQGKSMIWERYRFELKECVLRQQRPEDRLDECLIQGAIVQRQARGKIYCLCKINPDRSRWLL